MAITGRILTALYYNKMKKTNLAMVCRLSYKGCMLYLDKLDTFNLLRREIDEDGYEILGLNENGIRFYKNEYASLDKLSLF